MAIAIMTITKAKTPTTITMTTTTITTTVASRSCWLHKFSKVDALTSQNLKVTHLCYKVCRLVHLCIKVRRLAQLHFQAYKLVYFLKINVHTSQRLMYLHSKIGAPKVYVIWSIDLYRNGASHTS